MGLVFALMLTRLAPSAAPGSLDREIRAIAQDAGGAVGVAVRHVESGQGVSLRGAERFPMASVFKLPLGIEILHRVDDGALSLDRVVRFGIPDLSPGHSPLAE